VVRSTRFAAVALGATLLVTGVWSGVAGADAFRKGPYLQNVGKTSITIMWETSRPAEGVIRLFGAGAPRQVHSERTDLHEVVIDGLSPGTRYRYEIECAGERVTGEFATAPEHTAPISFVVFGDTRSNDSAHRRVVERILREVPDFLLGTGDWVDDGGREHEWQRFFEIERELLRDNVLYPALGNHDRQGRGRTADNFRAYFSLPENSPDPERYYAYTYGNSRFLVLDSNAYSFALTDQTAWIEEQLQAARLDPKIRHIFVAMHHPVFSVALHGGHAQLRHAWAPLFERYQVTAVFSGHDHVYSRADRAGVRYFVSGGGGAPLYPRSRNPSRIDLDAVRYFERVNHYLRVNVIGDFVEVAAIRADGSLIETVSWGSRPRPSEAVAAARARPGQVPTDERETPVVRAAGAGASGGPVEAGGGFGLMGKLGALLMLVAGGVLVWTLRS
jgi:acid phosphatase type 7